MSNADKPTSQLLKEAAIHTILVIGVSGSGKTTLGKQLAERYSAEFIDADDFHSPQAVAKMREGIALSDADRIPWLHRVGSAIRKTEGPVVCACSALTRRYRDLLRTYDPDLRLVFLNPAKPILQKRMEAREHFMPASLLNSQLSLLEPPEDGELLFPYL